MGAMGDFIKSCFPILPISDLEMNLELDLDVSHGLMPCGLRISAIFRAARSRLCCFEPEVKIVKVGGRSNSFALACSYKLEHFTDCRYSLAQTAALRYMICAMESAFLRSGSERQKQNILL